MRKILIVLLLSFLPAFSMGEEIFIAKPGDEEGKSCQAVRLKDTWFLTAAHCVTDVCNAECEVKMQMSEEIIETSQKNVYWLNERQSNNASYDIALINFKNAKIPGKFKEPQILIVDNSVKLKEPKIIDRSLEIPFNFSGNIGEIASLNEIFYGPKSKIIFTADLGLFHGLSGAGVFTDKGELIAITSSTASKGNDIRFSVFSVFDDRVESFIKQKIPSLYFKHISQADFREVQQDKEILISLDNNI